MMIGTETVEVIAVKGELWQRYELRSEYFRITRSSEQWGETRCSETIKCV